MDTGVLSVILHQFPYPSHWTRVCSTIMFVANIVLFLTISTLYLLRWVLFYRSTQRACRSDPEEIALEACPAIAWLTLTIQVQVTCAENWGYGWTILAYVMWWVALIWILAILLILYIHLIKYHSSSIVDISLPTAVFIPVVGIFTVANAAGLIVNNAKNDTHISSHLAVPLIIVSFMCVGFGLGLGFIVYSVYTHRLMTSGWPAYLKVPAMILTIGPCGQSASALIQLGNATVSHHNFANYAEGYFLTAEAAPIIRIVCILAALLLVGFAVFWMCVDYYAIAEGLIHHKIHPSLFWWSSIFPVGTVVTAFAGLGDALDSPAMKVVSVIIFVFLLVIYFINASFTIPMTLSGELLGLPKKFDLKVPLREKHEHHAWATFPRKSRTS